MTVIAYVPPLVALIAGLLYRLVPPPHAEYKEMSRLAFFAAFLVMMSTLSSHIIHL